MGVPFFIAVILTLGMAFLLGLAIERGLLRPMIGQPLLSVIMMTIALGSFIRGLVFVIWGPFDNSYPAYLPTEPMHLGDLAIDPVYVWGSAVALVLMVAFALYFKYTKSGLAMRATAESEHTALAMGIDVRGVYGRAWAISCFTAAVGGIVMGTMLSIGYMLGTAGLRVFPAVIVGGLDSIPGAIVGGLIIGIVEALSGGYVDRFLVSFKEIAPYIIMLLILLIRPYGLFGLKRIERI